MPGRRNCVDKGGELRLYIVSLENSDETLGNKWRVWEGLVGSTIKWARLEDLQFQTEVSSGYLRGDGAIGFLSSERTRGN